MTDPAGVAAASIRCRNAATSWAELPALERARRLEAAADALAARHQDLVDLMIREVGKPIVEADGEVRRAVALTRFHAQLALSPSGESHPPEAGQRELLTVQRPHGVVGLITPWNFPVAIPLWKAVPALAVGNGVLIKPSPESAAVTDLAMTLLRTHLPEHLVQIVHGGSATGAAVVGESDAVSFTGSTAVGTEIAIACARRGCPVQAEMGGHNPAIVLPDVDVDHAADQIAYAIAGYAGQKCTATRRVIVVGPAAQAVDALAAALDAVPVGDPAEPHVLAGPLIDENARERAADAVRSAVGKDGGRVVTGGHAWLSDSGPYSPPVLLDGLSPTAELLHDEVFAPVAAVIPAATVDEAVELANRTEYGLTAAVYGTDLERARAVARRLRMGMVKVNEPTTGASIHVPFGGVGRSSIGPREQGVAAARMFTWTQTLAVSAGSVADAAR